MEALKKDAGKSLAEFTTSLLNYRANPVSVSIQSVLGKHKEWVSRIHEYDQDSEALRQEYIEKHDAPRSVAQKEYTDFLQQKKSLFYEWQRTRREGDLYAWLKPTFQGDTTPLQDTIYTMYANPKYL